MWIPIFQWEPLFFLFCNGKWISLDLLAAKECPVTRLKKNKNTKQTKKNNSVFHHKCEDSFKESSKIQSLQRLMPLKYFALDKLAFSDAKHFVQFKLVYCYINQISWYYEMLCVLHLVSGEWNVNYNYKLLLFLLQSHCVLSWELHEFGSSEAQNTGINIFLRYWKKVQHEESNE